MTLGCSLYEEDDSAWKIVVDLHFLFVSLHKIVSFIRVQLVSTKWTED